MLFSSLTDCCITDKTTEEKEDKPSFRLTYYAFTGRGAPIRTCAYLGGLSYEDNFITYDEHVAAKKAGKRIWGGLPEITIFSKDGSELVTTAQSNACLRYVGMFFT